MSIYRFGNDWIKSYYIDKMKITEYLALPLISDHCFANQDFMIQLRCPDVFKAPWIQLPGVEVQEKPTYEEFAFGSVGRLSRTSRDRKPETFEPLILDVAKNTYLKPSEKPSLSFFMQMFVTRSFHVALPGNLFLPFFPNLRNEWVAQARGGVLHCGLELSWPTFHPPFRSFRGFLGRGLWQDPRAVQGARVPTPQLYERKSPSVLLRGCMISLP